MKRLICCALIALCFCPAPLLGVELGIDLPMNSKYMWRGLELNEDPVFQPDIWAKFKGFSLTVWGNMETTNVHNGPGENGESGDFTEFDYILKYEGNFNKLNYNLGYIYYDYPHTAYDCTYEFFGSIGYAGLLSPTITLYRDFKEADGWYMTLALSHAVEFKAFLSSTLTLSGTAGFSSENHTEYYYGEGATTCTDALLSASLKIPVTDNIAIVPSVNYTALLGSVRDKGLNKRDDTFWCGINLAFNFDVGGK